MPAPRFLSLPGGLALGLLAALALAAPSSASAQRRFAIFAEAGSGVSIAGSDGQALVRRTPTYLEAGMFSWLAHDDGVWVGGSLRAEIEDRASIGGVVRAGFFLRADILELRPAIGLVAFLAPYTLVGAEVGLVCALALGDVVAITARILVDGFFTGSDLVPGSILLMANGAVGVEIRL